MERPSVKVLDNGFVQLLDTFGDDLTVVNTARVKHATRMTPKDEKLIKHLADSNTTHFFHPQIRLRIKMPIFIAREWFYNQAGFARSEMSRGYVDEEPEMYSPTIARADLKTKSIHQNSIAVTMIRDINERASETYQQLIEMGVAPEVARTVLPQGTYMEFIETGSLASYARLCDIRLDPAAQLEIRLYADAVKSLLMEKFPVSWRALMREKEKGEENVSSAPLEEMPPLAPSPPEHAEWVKKLISHINQC
jgi:thymidylate synthase (FAD)